MSLMYECLEFGDSERTFNPLLIAPGDVQEGFFEGWPEHRGQSPNLRLLRLCDYCLVIVDDSDIN